MQSNKLTSFLIDELEAQRKGGLYHKTQVQLAYNSNHFVAFDYLLRTIEEPLSEEIIKEFHRILKNGTADAQMYYYWGLSEFKQTPGFLVGTIQSAQDVYETWVKYFNPALLEGLKME